MSLSASDGVVTSNVMLRMIFCDFGALTLPLALRDFGHQCPLT